MDVFGVKNENILDVYGFTEQLGTVYISRGNGMKEIPKISKVIVRDPYTLEVLKDNKEGLLQFLNPIPYSYPGLSVLTDDLGIKKVGEYICSKQIAFFENNPLKMNTLSNKEIANEIGVHPSTVSRILRYKYIDTPKGIMTLKSLLISSVSRTRDISASQLMKLIEDIINSEKKPKSDKKITIELNKRGFSLARRTISKYRKKNNIPSSRYR